jgi:hypothetical protein
VVVGRWGGEDVVWVEFIFRPEIVDGGGVVCFGTFGSSLTFSSSSSARVNSVSTVDDWMLATGCVVEEKWSRLDCAGCLSPAAGLAAGEAVGEEGEEGDDALLLC